MDTVERFDPRRAALVLGHFDADGLAAVAIMARALRGMGREVDIRIVGKGENPWDEKVRRELAERPPPCSPGMRPALGKTCCGWRAWG